MDDRVILLNYGLIPFLIKFIKTELLKIIPKYDYSTFKDTLNDTRKLIKLYKKEHVYRLVKNPNKYKVTEFQSIISAIKKCEYIDDIETEFSQLYRLVRDTQTFLNKGKKKEKDFNTAVAKGSLKWYRQNKKEIFIDIDENINLFVNKIAEEFLKGSGIKKSDKKITFYQVLDGIDSYFDGLEDEDIKQEFIRLINELKSRGWDI